MSIHARQHPRRPALLRSMLARTMSCFSKPAAGRPCRGGESSISSRQVYRVPAQQLHADRVEGCPATGIPSTVTPSRRPMRFHLPRGLVGEVTDRSRRGRDPALRQEMHERLVSAFGLARARPRASGRAVERLTEPGGGPPGPVRRGGGRVQGRRDSAPATAAIARADRRDGRPRRRLLRQ